VQLTLLSTSSRPALRPTQPTIRWVPRALCPEVKRQGREADHSPPTCTKVKKTWTYRSSLSYFFRDPQQAAQCVYSIPRDCGRSYIGETGRPIAVRFREDRHHLKEGLLEKTKLAQHAYEEGHRVLCDEA
jgi:hypothetical protein